MRPFKVSNYGIRAVAWFFFIILSLRLISYCTEEKDHARSYPRVKTDPVSNITGNGATFNGEILSLGNEPILEHGFVWGTGGDPNLSNSKILLGRIDVTGLYSAEILTNLSQNVEYTVKSFVKTADHIIYGIPKTFLSLGSGAPVIIGFKPDSAAWMDTLKISGKNFSLQPKENIVKLNQAACHVISATDTTLVVEVSSDVKDLKNIVSVEISGNSSSLTNNPFSLIFPKLISYYPEKAFWGDTLHLSGRHFKSFINSSANSIKLGTLTCKPVGILTDSTLTATIPFEISVLQSDLTLNINGIIMQASKQFELLPPFFTITPKYGTWGTTITLTGRFNSTVSMNKVFFKGIQGNEPLQATILSTALNSLKIKVPADLADINSKVIYDVSPFSITSKDTFHLAPPVINSFSPISGPTGTIVTIRGKYFDVASPGVKFGNVVSYINNINDSVIVAVVPAGITGNVRISVITRSQTVESINYFNVTNPKITNIFPLSGTFNDEVTITGDGFISPFGSTTVTFDGIPADIKTLSATSIVVMVPVAMDSIPRVLTVTVGSEAISSILKFVLSPHQIFSVSPAAVNPGQDIVITGTGFNPDPDGNGIIWDIYPLMVKSASKTEIVATWPLGLPRDNKKLKVVVGGYSRSSVQEFTSDSKWLRINSPQIPTSHNWAFYLGNSNYAESINGYGYIASEPNQETYKFDPSNNQFSALNIATQFTPGGYTIQGGEVVCKDTFYIISGRQDSYSMWAIDGITNQWRTIPLPAELARMGGVAFSLNNKIYFGLDLLSAITWFYECDPANNYTWTRTTDFPETPPVPFSAYFSVGNKGYVLFNDNSLWQFDPDIKQWAGKANFPGSSRWLAFSFVLGNHGYVGAGRNDNDLTGYNDIWMYDPLADSWILESYMPGNRYLAIAFSIGNKAYVGFGVTSSSDLFDFYEYDPNYPAK